MYNGDKSVIDDSVLEFEVDKVQRAERMKRRKDRAQSDFISEAHDDLLVDELLVENEPEASTSSKDKRRKKKRYLVYDEDQGRVVVKRRRKRRRVPIEEDW